MPYYAVKKGRKPGVYNTWPECNDQVKGFPGAEFKKFAGKSDAELFVYGFNASKSIQQNITNNNFSCSKLSKEKVLEVSLYTDGACSGNPGKGGYGYAVVVDESLTLKGSGGLLATTNNQMELTAVIEGLKVVPENYAVVVYSDSTYVVNAFQKDWISGWKARNWIKSDGNPVANRELWEELLEIINSRPAVRFVWVKGHADNKYNELCDRLAVEAIKSLTL